jgi:hypothetical protein
MPLLANRSLGVTESANFRRGPGSGRDRSVPEDGGVHQYRGFK